MKEENNILNQINKRKQPKVPNGFFDSFADELMSKIDTEQSVLNSIKKREQPKVPELYFEDLTDKLKLNDVPKNKIISLKALTIITAIAASLLLLFVLNNNTSNINIAKEKTELIKSNPTINEVDIQEDDYLSYFDEEDLIDFIVDNQLPVNENNIEEEIYQDDLYDELETELDDYIYEL